MESLEKAIRTAFDKGDPTDPAFRKRVYRSALTALEKSAAANPAITQDVAAARRETLKSIIRDIETEFRPAAEPQAAPVPQAAPEPAAQTPPEPVPTPEPAPAPEPEPEVAPATAPEPMPEPVAEAAPEASDVVAAEATPSNVSDEPAPEVTNAPATQAQAQPVPEVTAETVETQSAQTDAPPVEIEAAPDTHPQDVEPDAPAEARREPDLDVAPSLDDELSLDMDAGELAVAPPSSDDHAPRSAPAPAAERREAEATGPYEDDKRPGDGARSRGLMLPFLIGSAIVVVGGIYLFSKYGQSGPAPDAGTRIESSGPASRDQAREDRRNWIGVFDPADPSTVSASGGTELEILDRDQTKFLRINANGNASAAVLFDVGQGIMRDFAGGKAVFDISARAQEGKMVEISVECDFGAQGGCGRRRYEVGFSPGEYLFDVEIPANAGSSAGKVILTPDSAGTGAFIDVSEIRVTVPDTQ